MDIICTNNLFITDSRKVETFKTHLFGGYLKTDVISLLEKKILEGLIESACYLAYQLLVSGHLKVLWDKLLTISYKQIRNPNLIKWIYYKNRDITRIINKYKKSSELLHIRNSQLVRNIITELIVLIAVSMKKDKIELLKRKPGPSAFDISKFYNELKNKDNYIVKDLTGPNDTNEVCYIANELAHTLINKNIQKGLYWIDWLLQWEKQNIAKFKKFEVQSREINGIESKYNRNIIWLIWCVILFVKNKMDDKLRAFYGNKYIKLTETLDFIWLSYLYEWKPSVRNKRMILIYLYINYLLNPQDMTISLLGNIKMPEYLKILLLVQEKIFIKIKEQCHVDRLNYFNPFLNTS
jgi:DNA-binding transcriptional ArsR family regulator